MTCERLVGILYLDYRTLWLRRSDQKIPKERHWSDIATALNEVSGASSSRHGLFGKSCSERLDDSIDQPAHVPVMRNEKQEFTISAHLMSLRATVLSCNFTVICLGDNGCIDTGFELSTSPVASMVVGRANVDGIREVNNEV